MVSWRVSDHQVQAKAQIMCQALKLQETDDNNRLIISNNP
jgi:hypothetical protein